MSTKNKHFFVFYRVKLIIEKNVHAYNQLLSKFHWFSRELMTYNKAVYDEVRHIPKVRALT